MIELADAVRINTDDLTIKNSVVHWQFSKSNTQTERVEMILIAGHQFAFAIIYISDCAETVVLEFEDVIRVVEWLGDTLEPHWLDAGEHSLF